MIARKDKSIPYDEIDLTVKRAWELWPEAVKIKPGYHGGRIYVEVYDATGHAKVYFLDG